MMDFSYEKKYALIELKEYAGYCEEFEMRIIKTYAYMVRECYLVDKISINKENGRIRDYYEVVFLDDYPKYYPNGCCYNSNIVDKVFDDIEEAIKYRDVRNMMLMAKYVYNSQEKDISNTKMRFLEKLEDVYKLEEEKLGNKNLKVKSKTKS